MRKGGFAARFSRFVFWREANNNLDRLRAVIFFVLSGQYLLAGVRRWRNHNIARNQGGLPGFLQKRIAVARSSSVINDTLGQPRLKFAPLAGYCGHGPSIIGQSGAPWFPASGGAQMLIQARAIHVDEKRGGRVPKVCG